VLGPTTGQIVDLIPLRIEYFRRKDIEALQGMRIRHNIVIGNASDIQDDFFKTKTHTLNKVIHIV
jgi:hypothetical protein